MNTELHVSDAGVRDKAPKDASGQRGLKLFRASRPEDIFAIRDIAHEFHAESRYRHLQFSEQKFARLFGEAITNPNMLAVYVQQHSKTVGLLQAGVGDYYLGEGGRIATVYGMYVSRRVRGTILGGRVGLRLLRMASDWGKTQGACELHIHSTSGVEPHRTDKLLRRLGFYTFGGNYAARLA